MFVLGLILVLLAVGVFGVALGGANDTAQLDVGVVNAELSTLAVFLLGAAATLLLVLGFSVMRTGLLRARQRRRDRKELNRLSKTVQRQESEKRAVENDRVAEQRQPGDSTERL
ncbi:hypothetical protein [Nocardioides mesophilus]|uniref:LapA family protein n=1 Tax=Nocardioides mesophilus TaxID=433659 RepID=A0A7G9RGE8_9ACTN|nr:hypothetical protein [Nocardioides mesophilus]QNN54673.1 hypothetical protein H9L09_10435 [Nocardioides mesophilus]